MQVVHPVYRLEQQSQRRVAVDIMPCSLRLPCVASIKDQLLPSTHYNNNQIHTVIKREHITVDC